MTAALSLFPDTLSMQVALLVLAVLAWTIWRDA